MADEATDKVSMNWPAGLKDEVRKLVGTRGVTAFVITAVRKELDLRARESPNQPAPVPPGGPNDVDDQGVVGAVPAPQATQEATHAPAESAAQPVAPQERVPSTPEPDTRGEKVAVALPTLGVAAKFSSSTSALEELRAKGAALGIKSASELPRPAVLRDDDPPRTEDVTVVERQEPEIELTGQPQEMPGAPEYMQPTRNLDDIEVDF